MIQLRQRRMGNRGKDRRREGKAEIAVEKRKGVERTEQTKTGESTMVPKEKSQHLKPKLQSVKAFALCSRVSICTQLERYQTDRNHYQTAMTRKFLPIRIFNYYQMKDKFKELNLEGRLLVCGFILSFLSFTNVSHNVL